MLDRVLNAFFNDRLPSPKVRRIWLAAILLAPLALAGGLSLRFLTAGAEPPPVQLDRAAALAIARQFAAAHGYLTNDWATMVRLDADPDQRRWMKERATAPLRDLLARVDPPEALTVQLFSPRHDGRVDVRLTLDGRLLGYQMRGRPQTQSAPPGTPSLDAAQAVLNARFDNSKLLTFGKPEVSTISREGGHLLEKVEWRTAPDGMPEMEIRQTVEVRDGQVTVDSITGKLNEKYSEEHRPHKGLMAALGWFFGVYIVVLVVLVVVRYIQRTLQKEISHGRSAIIGLFVAATFVSYIFLSDQIINGEVEGPEVPFWLIRLMGAVVYLFIGAVVGLSYSASEGDLREYYPGKLTTLDALLTGRLFSRNAAASILVGIVIASWMLFFNNSISGVWHLPSIADNPESLALFVYSREPLLMLLVSTPIGAIMESLTLLLPISILHRVAGRRNLVLAVLIPLAFLSALGFALSQAGHGEVDLRGLALTAVVRTAGPLIAFFAYDLLACIVCLTAFSIASYLLVLLSALPHGELVLFGAVTLVVIVIIAEIWALIQGKVAADEEVRPKYARRLAERIQLQAEVTAAREAQLRLLPTEPPKMEGLAIAATCTAADEVGGDFYDFFRLSPHRLGLLVSDGGGRGLATALSIALAKGYLMQKVHAGLTPAETMRALRAALGSAMQGDESSGFCYAVIDTHAMTFEYARTGSSPCIVAESPAPESLVDGSIFCGKAQLGEGLRFIVYTDGIGTRIGRPGKGATERWIQQVLAWHRNASAEEMSGAILREVFSSVRRNRAKLQDDITLVVVAMDRSGIRSMENVA
jgi:hypothetical protein